MEENTLKDTPIIKLIDAVTARARFGALLKSLEKQNTRFLISRRGKPKAVILSIEDYLKNFLKKPSILAKMQTDAEKAGLNLISDEEIIVEVENSRRKS